MLPLKPFVPNSLSADVSANAQLKGSKWLFEYVLNDPRGVVQDSLSPGQWKNWERADGLWQSTCFEAFVGRPGEPGYWEFNFSPAKRAWNAYAFENYRSPQPPRPAKEFEFEEASVTGNALKCVVLTKALSPPPFEASLTAVIRTAGGICYFALTHATGKADFHKRETFSLRLS
jgi:hypothetical protein